MNPTVRTQPRVGLAIAIAIAAALALGSCRGKKRHFEPAPKPELIEPDGGPEPDEVAQAGDGDGDGDSTAADGDGGPVASNGDGDGDGDGDGPSGNLSDSDANAVVAFLDKELPADTGAEKLFTKLARKCSELDVCAPAACRTVLASCSGGDLGGCGSRLLANCSEFRGVAQGLGGAQLVERTDIWVRDLWGDLLVKVRMSLPEKKQGKVDELAARHQL